MWLRNANGVGKIIIVKIVSMWNWLYSYDFYMINIVNDLLSESIQPIVIQHEQYDNKLIIMNEMNSSGLKTFF